MSDDIIVGDYEECRDCGRIIPKGTQYGLCSIHEQEYINNLQQFKAQFHKN